MGLSHSYSQLSHPPPLNIHSVVQFVDPCVFFIALLNNSLIAFLLSLHLIGVKDWKMFWAIFIESKSYLFFIYSSPKLYHAFNIAECFKIKLLLQYNQIFLNDKTSLLCFVKPTILKLSIYALLISFILSLYSLLMLTSLSFSYFSSFNPSSPNALKKSLSKNGSRLE